LKKILSIAIAFLYLLVSTGLVVEIHHCMGRVANADIHLFAVADPSNTCGSCGMEKGQEGQHCCKDELKQVKISSDQLAAFLHYTITGAWAALPQPLFEWQPTRLTLRVQQTAWLSRPPPDLPTHEPAYLRVFRI